MDNEKQIIDSWKINATSWIDLIERNGIESRKLATNKAILETVSNSKPGSVLDIGCGEGWLLKELSPSGIKLMGIDVIPELISNAKEKVKAELLVGSYEDIAGGKISFSSKADAIVINFALIGKESTENLLAALPSFLSPSGKLFIQTLHPHTRKSIDDYKTGWKEGSWDGLGPHFTNPYQWYFRTLEDWLALLEKSGFKKIESCDIINPQTGQLLSVIFECEKN